MKIISTQKNNCHYLITVIKGQPFYCSIESSATVPGTWLFFCGKLEKQHHNHQPGLFKQPTLSQNKDNASDLFGDKVWQFIQSHGINSVFPMRRFGDLHKMCVSASLGGGFWRTSKGMFLKQHLKIMHPNLHLNAKEIKKFRKSYGKQFSYKKHDHAIDGWLKKQGVSPEKSQKPVKKSDEQLKTDISINLRSSAS